MPFQITEDQYLRILNRLTALEEHHNDIVVAMSNFVTLSQVNQLLTVLQEDIADVDARISSLEDRVAAIEQEPLT